MEVIPAEPAIVELEKQWGIESDSYVLSEVMEEYGYDSSDVLRNLEIMSILLFVLILLPIVLLLLYSIFIWSEKCRQCLSKLHMRIFWNVYIRFIFEGFMELSIATLLRF